MKHENDLSDDVSVTRRSTLKAVGSSIAITGTGGITSASDGKREIIVSRKGNEIRDTELVPKDWYQHIQFARTDLETAQNQHASQPGVVNTMLIRSEKTYGGKPGTAIKIEVESEFEGSLPSRIGTTPVTTEEEKETVLTACYYDEGFSNMPAGVAINNPDDSSTKSEMGTAGSRVNHNGYPRHITSAHIFDACENNPTASGSAETLYHNGTARGDVIEANSTHDWAVVNDGDGNGYYTDQIESGSGTIGSVQGHVTEDGLSSLMTSQDYVVEKQGIMTGHQQYGTLDAIHTSSAASCTDMSGDGVRNSLDQTVGDSGGPVFRVKNGDLEIISLATIGTTDSGSTHSCSDSMLYAQSEGYAAYAILNESNIKSFA